MHSRLVRGAVAAFALFTAFPASAADDGLPSPLREADVIARVRARNPEVGERRALAEAARARPRQVSQLDDPMVSLEWWQQPIDFATVPLMLSIKQPLPWPGKLRARKDVATREAATATTQIDEAAERLVLEARQAFLDLFLAERLLDVNERQRTLLQAMVQSAESAYRVGRAPQATLLKAQSDLLTIDNDRVELEVGRDEARGRLNALLDRDPGAPVPATEGDIAHVALPPEEELVARALAHRPEVRVAEDAVREAEARVALARREVSPELAVWAGYMLNIRGVDTFTVGVSSTLPIFSARRRTSAVEAAEAEVRARKAAVDAIKRRTARDVHAALLQMTAAWRHQQLHLEKLIPLAELQLRSAQAAYQNARLDLVEVLDAARMLRDHHVNHERFRVEYGKRLAELERALGAPLQVKQ